MLYVIVLLQLYFNYYWWYLCSVVQFYYSTTFKLVSYVFFLSTPYCISNVKNPLACTSQKHLYECLFHFVKKISKYLTKKSCFNILCPHLLNKCLYRMVMFVNDKQRHWQRVSWQRCPKMKAIINCLFMNIHVNYLYLHDVIFW